MDERLGEIAGTLARTKERKSTILYKAEQRKREEEKLARLGVKRLPANPRETNDPKVMRFVISQLQSEVGERIEQLRRPGFLSVEKNGESTVRAKNDEVNQLLAKKNAWEMKLADVTNADPPPFQRRKFFFGCAKDLPEAASHKRPREEGTDDDEQAKPPKLAADAGHSSHNSTPTSVERPQTTTVDYFRAVASLVSEETNAKLLVAEKEAERRFKESTRAKPDAVTVDSKSTETKYVNSYMEAGKLQLPDEDYFRQAQVERKKQALQERLQALKSKNMT